MIEPYNIFPLFSNYVSHTLISCSLVPTLWCDHWLSCPTHNVLSTLISRTLILILDVFPHSGSIIPFSHPIARVNTCTSFGVSWRSGLVFLLLSVACPAWNSAPSVKLLSHLRSFFIHRVHAGDASGKLRCWLGMLRYSSLRLLSLHPPRRGVVLFLLRLVRWLGRLFVSRKLHVCKIKKIKK